MFNILKNDITFTLIYNLQPLPEIKKIAKVEKFVADLPNKTKNFLHIRNKNKI